VEAAEFSVGVVRPPGAAAFDFSGLDGAVADLGVRAEAAVEGGEVDEGFEDGADLALAVLGAVEA
jgi:hypothetical protein